MSAEETVQSVIESKAFSLEDLVPDEAKITLGEKEYTLRKINLQDEVWLKQFGDVQKNLDKEDMTFMSRLAFRLLTDKTDFMAIEIDGCDDDGNVAKIKKTGPERILEALSGPKQKYELIKAICVTFGISRPLFDKMVEEALKKSNLTMETKVESPTGESSSTSLPPNTDSKA